jgi:hypothetical protein
MKKFRNLKYGDPLYKVSSSGKIITEKIKTVGLNRESDFSIWTTGNSRFCPEPNTSKHEDYYIFFVEMKDARNHAISNLCKMRDEKYKEIEQKLTAIKNISTEIELLK